VNLPDIKIAAADGDANKQIESLVRQLNDWGRVISAQRIFEIIDSGEVTVTVPNGDETTQLSFSEIAEHNLGYSPMVFCWVVPPPDAGTGLNAVPSWSTMYSGTGDVVGIGIYGATMQVTDNYIDFAVHPGDLAESGGDWKFKYYIVRDKVTQGV
jgi:hypothetical protein